jgi:ATP-dependent helicase HrpA
VDPGTARISRYSHRTKVQRLPIEPISQASADQRAGRCGRVEAGVCIRLYSEEDYAARPRFTDPEVTRTNLASVILQMAALGLGDVAAFPFVEPPDRRGIRDGVALLAELGAIEQPRGRTRLTEIGRRLAAFPVDPRIARMIVQAGELGCAHDVIVIAAALSIVDPRERPADNRELADRAHARFAVPGSDLLGYLALWRYLREKQHELSSNKFRRLCRDEFLNYLRVREWQDVAGQLRQVARSLGIAVADTPAGSQSAFHDDAIDDDAIHRSLLAGLLSHVGMRDPQRRDYLGVRNTRFAVFPGSTLAKKQPRWVVAAELVETGRLWARGCARIEPEWVEALAGHLVKRSYSEPHWDAGRGAVMAYEKVSLFGLPVVASRPVGYGRIDPVLSRELFIRYALVEGDWNATYAFREANRRRIEEIASLEARTRRRDLLVDDEALFELYDTRIPAEVVSTRHFDAWWKQARRSDPSLLDIDTSMLLARTVDTAGFPDSWCQGKLVFTLRYVFEPGDAADGVTVQIPLAVLNQVRADDFSWGVPGHRQDLVTALLRSLPKPLRRHFVPAPDVARTVTGALQPASGPIEQALSAELSRRGVRVEVDDFDWAKVPQYLQMRFEIVGDDGRPLAASRELPELVTRLAGQLRARVRAAARALERDGARTWSFGELPEIIEDASLRVRGYPALVDQRDAVGVRVLESAEQAATAHRHGLRRLLLLNLPSPARQLQQRLSNATKLGLKLAPRRYASAGASQGATGLLDDCLAGALDEVVARSGGAPRDEAGFSRLLAHARIDLPDLLTELVTVVADVITAAEQIDNQIKTMSDPRLLPTLLDVRDQVARIVHPGFVAATGAGRVPDLRRYLAAASHRLDRAPLDVNRDRARMAEVEQAAEALADARQRLGDVPALDDICWMIEELRVSLFAQVLGTAQPVSLRRILRAIDAVLEGSTT